MKETSVTISNSTNGNQKVDNERYDQINRKRVTEALDDDFTSKLAEYVTKISC